MDGLNPRLNRICLAVSFLACGAVVDAQVAPPPAPPLSMNSTLLTAARAHSQNMLQNNYQGHTGPDGSLSTRLAGYTSTNGNWSLGENVYSYCKSVWYGHAGFEVDWGGTVATGGMQSPPGHRQNIHSATFREVGVGVVL